jgi:membrane protease YdiL (CAAX protease family)
MPVIAAFFFYLLGCMALSAVLLPWIHPLLDAWFGASADRVLYRFAMLLALIGMPFFLRAMRLRGREAAGFQALSGGWRPALGKGLIYGVLILAGLLLILLASGARVVSPHEEITVFLLLKYVLAGLASGLAVGLIEEFFFRGPMQTGARRTLGFWPTAILIGAFYSMVHFMRPMPPSSEEVTIAEAFAMMWGGFAQLGNVAEIADRFVALLVAGVFLSMVRERTGSILWAIGIHAGWVTTIKVGKKFTDTNPDAAAYFLLSNDGITGWGSAAWMAAIALAYWWWSAPKRKSR